MRRYVMKTSGYSLYAYLSQFYSVFCIKVQNYKK